MSAAENDVFVPDLSDAEERTAKIYGVVVGTLLGFNSHRQPLVIHRKQLQRAALEASSIVDLHGAHIGRQVILQFEDGSPQKPIVMGVLQNKEGWPLADRPAQVEVDLDGERMIVSAKHELVLRCGKASLTLTRAGKVLIQGTYVSQRSLGVIRIKGGSVQLN